jgi:hypothetical protein
MALQSGSDSLRKTRKKSRTADFLDHSFSEMTGRGNGSSAFRLTATTPWIAAVADSLPAMLRIALQAGFAMIQGDAKENKGKKISVTAQFDCRPACR